MALRPHPLHKFLPEDLVVAAVAVATDARAMTLEPLTLDKITVSLQV